MLSLTPQPQPGLPPVHPTAPAVVVYTRDLMLESKLAADAQASGWRFWAEARPQAPPSRLQPDEYRLAVFDLTLGTDSLGALVTYWQTERRVPVLAFGSHVATESLETAERLGCREVWTRGRLHAQFAQRLRDPAWLVEDAGESPPTAPGESSGR